MKTDSITKLGWIASIMTVIMYSSYIDQIRLHLEGYKGSLILSIATFVNCTAWILYGALKPKKDYPIILCNLVGFILGIIGTITQLI